MRNLKLLSCVTIFLIITVPAISSEDDVQKKDINLGFIFNTSSILFDIESYQAGLGAKLLFENDIACRFLFDGFYSSSADTFSLSLGGAVEKHFGRKRVSPYLGGFVEAGVMRQLNETDADNWTKNISVPLSAGAILGVEFFIVENLSLFAEYNVVFEGSILKTSSSVGGVVTEADPEFSYTIDTGIGNESKLGIVIYLDDVVKIDKN